jgi:membrane-associated protease RseP (regulator of RpoE activity)
MAGGAVVEKSDDELVGGVRGAIGVAAIVALFGVLAIFSIWWLVFALGLLIMIFFHELGHFSTARWTGMKATQFFIGFGPRVWSFRRGETEYGVRALPLGAFVRIIGMNNMDEVAPEDESRSYRSKSYPRRLLVISAGSLAHMVMAILLLFVVYVADGEVATADRGIETYSVLDGGPASAAGLQPNDIVLAIDGVPVEGADAIGAAVQSSQGGDEVLFTVARGATQTDLSDATVLDIPIVLAVNDDPESTLYDKPYIGISSGSPYVTIEHSVPMAAVNAVTDIFPTSWEMTKGAVKVLNPVSIFTHLTGSNQDLATRPTTLVGVTALSDDVGESQGIVGILFLLAVLNVFVGVFNMFPLLPLDGGHAAIATYERLRERNGERYYADVARLMPFAMVVMTVLLFLFMSGLYLDITNPVG